ncbi:MAG: rRNA pseudouridine synthase [Thermomicrobiales bacterium]|nr:rRNA pseudouridine synthase [Thermomicrobiales bacterium]
MNRRGETLIDATERLQRILAARGVASRRKAEALIVAGRVSVSGQVVTELGTRVDPQADIRVDGQRLRPQRSRYLLLNKPQGVITTTSDERGRQTVMGLVHERERLYPVGRLDRDTEGLLLLTNDGDVANRVMHPRYGLAKEYNILTPRRPSEAAMRMVRSGIVIDDRKVVPDEFRILRETRDGVLLTITVHEGIHHVVRRLMEAVEIPVTRLRRIRIGPLALGVIPMGAYRDLTAGELTSLLEALGLDRPEGDRLVGAGRGRPRRAGRESRPTAPKRGSAPPVGSQGKPGNARRRSAVDRTGDAPLPEATRDRPPERDRRGGRQERSAEPDRPPKPGDRHGKRASRRNERGPKQSARADHSERRRDGDG